MTGQNGAYHQLGKSHNIKELKEILQKILDKLGDEEVIPLVHKHVLDKWEVMIAILPREDDDLGYLQN